MHVCLDIYPDVYLFKAPYNREYGYMLMYVTRPQETYNNHKSFHVVGHFLCLLSMVLKTIEVSVPVLHLCVAAIIIAIYVAEPRLHSLGSVNALCW